MTLQVSVYGMAEMSDEEVASALKDAVRVLKPGKVKSFPQVPMITLLLFLTWTLIYCE